MLPASVAIARADLALDPDRYLAVSFEPMGAAMAAILGERVDAITLGSRIFVAPAAFDEVLAGSRPDLVSHELTHVDQWRADGVGFPVRYLTEYLKLRSVGLPHSAAYRGISYEIDAFAAGKAQGT